MADETKRRVLIVLSLLGAVAAIVTAAVLAQPGPPGELIPLSSDLVLRGELELTLMRYTLWAVAANVLVVGTGLGTLLWRDGSRSSTIDHLRAEVKQMHSDMWMTP